MMSEKTQEPGAEICQNCGYMLALHMGANLTDGAFVGLYLNLTICPTALFLSKRTPRKSLPALPRLVSEPR